MARIDPHAVAIGKAVRAATGEAHLNLRELSDRTGIPRNTLSRRVNGALPTFSWTELVAVSQATGVPLGQIAANAERIAS